jgi:hypothetical protein
VTADLGDAVQFVASAKQAAHFEKRSRFVTGRIVGATGRAPEHVTRWMPSSAAHDAVTYESHAWAIRVWARLNT